MGEKSLATLIVEGLGGVSNISTFENCMTRLRVTVHDASKVDVEALTKVKGVIKVIGEPSAPHIVVGPGVADTVCNEIKNMDGIKYSEYKGEAVMSKKQATGIMDFFAKTFTPLIPAFAGAGLLFGVMKIFTVIFNLTGAPVFDPSTSKFMFAINVLASTFFTYLNLAVAASAAEKMGGNKWLGLIAGGIVINLGSLAGLPMGIGNLVFVNGKGGTLAALAAGALIATVEKAVKNRVPDALKIHVPALVSIIVTGLVTIYIIQPIAGFITDIATAGIVWLLDNLGFLAYGISAGLFLPLVMTGMHHGLSPLHTSFITTLGYTPLYAACSCAGGGNVGATLALMVKYKDRPALREAAIAGLPIGVLGIAEPLIFGVNLPLGRSFVTACLGAAVGGCVLGFFPGQGAVTMNVSGILGMLVNTKPLAYLLAYATSIVAGFIITYVVGVKESALDSFENAKNN